MLLTDNQVAIIQDIQIRLDTILQLNTKHIETKSYIDVFVENTVLDTYLLSQNLLKTFPKDISS